MGIVRKHLSLEGSKGRHETKGLFDSGTSYSFIRRSVAEPLGTLEPLPQPKRFEMAEQGKTVTVKERIALDFVIDGYRFSDEFLVLDDLAEEVIIGAKTMQAWRLKLDMEHEDIIIDPSVTRLVFI